jgi:hypothetical protein
VSVPSRLRKYTNLRGHHIHFSCKGCGTTQSRPLDLQPGEYAQVRSLEEIRSTLDEEERYRGLYFMPEMEEFYGKKYRVFKTVRSITLEFNGEVRKLKSPTVFLEGVYCNGKKHHDCDRSCLLFWREAWLKRAEP